MRLHTISLATLLFVSICGNAFCAEPEVKISVSNVSCHGGTDGAVSISISNIGEPVFISVEDTVSQKKYTKKFLSDTLYVLDELTATKVFLSVRTSETILKKEEMLLEEPQPLSGAEIVVVNAPGSDESCDATIKVEAKGGTPPYSFRWSENAQFASTELIENVCMGVYRCEINDSKMCGPVYTSIPLFKNTIEQYLPAKK